MGKGRQLLLGFFAALLSAGLLFGSLRLALSEGETSVAQAGTSTISVLPTRIQPKSPTPPSPTTTPTPRPSDTSEPSATPSLTPSVTPSPTSSALPSTTPTPGGCIPPEGWVAMIVPQGATLESIAATYALTPEELAGANCLMDWNIQPGQTLFVPAVLPTATEEGEPCGPPAGWVQYIVRPGDTLYALSKVLHVTIAELQWANCMGSSTVIRAGKPLWVPFLPPPPPTTPPTRTPEPTEAPPTATEPLPTATVPPPTDTPVPPPPTATVPAPTDTSEPPPPPTNTPEPPPTTQPPDITEGPF